MQVTRIDRGHGTTTPEGVIASAIGLGTRVSDVLGIVSGDGFARFRAVPVSGKDSFYDALRGVAMIGVGAPSHQGADGDLGMLETTLHEGTHHLIRRQTGWPGLPAGGQPGIVGEGLAQVIAGATMALLGPDERTRTRGWAALDPRGQFATIGRKRLPLSLSMQELHTRGPLLNDGGGVHVHGGIVQNAHYHLARASSLDTMLRITGEAMRGELRRSTGLRHWATSTLSAAERLYGVGSTEATQVRDAWSAVQLQLAG
ncbi:MAG: Thermolysin metallopeptidase alpha-helical domain [Thermoleophilia bacterium]|nr:Thermolysin metallopeptidase alpha-helical domain [Thermoleophilia bacterium]MCZ4496133.1 Thermolysin metallopeptidase alpha-helical domain [Thermoleophilia bacterium]